MVFFIVAVGVPRVPQPKQRRAVLLEPVKHPKPHHTLQGWVGG